MAKAVTVSIEHGDNELDIIDKFVKAMKVFGLKAQDVTENDEAPRIEVMFSDAPVEPGDKLWGQ
jgi:hypothetical protein